MLNQVSPTSSEARIRGVEAAEVMASILPHPRRDARIFVTRGSQFSPWANRQAQENSPDRRLRVLRYSLGFRRARHCSTKFRGCSSMVERLLPKQDTRVRFPSPALYIYGPPAKCSIGKQPLGFEGREQDRARIIR